MGRCKDCAARFIRWYQSLSRKNQIIFAVFFIHGVHLLFLTAEQWFSPQQLKQKKLAIRTFTLPAEPKKTPPIREQKTTAPVNASVSMAIKPQLLKKQPAKTATQAPAKNKSDSQQALLQEIENNLQVLSSLPSKTANKTEISVPVFFEPPPIETTPSYESEFASLNERIAAMLQETLQLPEFGEVKIFLSIDRFGRLQSLEVLESKSTKNAEFLKNRLPELLFPCLNEATSLTVVFSNAL